MFCNMHVVVRGRRLGCSDVRDNICSGYHCQQYNGSALSAFGGGLTAAAYFLGCRWPRE